MSCEHNTFIITNTLKYTEMKRLLLLLLLFILVLDIKSQNKYVQNDTTLIQ